MPLDSVVGLFFSAQRAFVIFGGFYRLVFFFGFEQSCVMNFIARGGNYRADCALTVTTCFLGDDWGDVGPCCYIEEKK